MKEMELKMFSISLPTAICFSFAAIGGEVIAETYHLQLSGDTDATFKGTCDFIKSDQATRLDLKGQLPFQQEIIGEQLLCQFDAVGRMHVDVTKGRSHTRASTNGGRITINLR